MDPDTTEHILPVPNIIEIPNLDRRKMDEYVDAFDAPQHGYRMRIGNWYAGSHLCHYECYRSGYPPGKPDTTKSLRIGCRFRLNGRFIPGKNCWILIHTHLGHNHPADPNVPRRKKAIPKDPILPHPYHLAVQTKEDEPDVPTPEAHPSESTNRINSIDTTLSKLRIRLQALSPCQQEEAILKIDSIFDQQESSSSNLTIEPRHCQPPINTYKDPTNSQTKHLTFNSPKIIKPLVDEFLTVAGQDSPDQSPKLNRTQPLSNESKFSPQQLQKYGPQPLSINHSVDNVFDNFFDIPEENTNSTFNLEDLLFHPDFDAQEEDPRLYSTQPIVSFDDVTTNILNNKKPPLDVPNPTSHVSKTNKAAKPPSKTKIPPSNPRITRSKRTCEQEKDKSKHCKNDDAAKPPSTTNTNTSLSTTITRIPRSSKQVVKKSVASPPPNTTDTTPPLHSPPKTTDTTQLLRDSELESDITKSAEGQATFGRQTRKRTLAQNTSIDNSTLPDLLKKYKIHKWLKPFILELHEVKADGHCGFRAIAVSLGRPQDDWLYVRQRLIETLQRFPKTFTDERLPEARTSLLTRLNTEEPDVLSKEEHWLSMPGIGGVIATAFDRPVLYYEPGHSSQVVFPYLTPINDNPPIVLVWAKRHFASVTLDYKNPELPVPRVCPTWNRFRSLMASTWLPLWNSMMEKHAEYLDRQNKGKRKKISQPISLSDSDN